MILVKPEILTAVEVAELLRIDIQTVWTHARKGKLKGFKAGKEWRFRAEDIQAQMTPKN